MKIIFQSYFIGDFAYVQRDDELWNIIDRHGNILSPNLWFLTVDNFHHGYAKVQRQDRLWNYIDMNGNILSPNLWFNLLDTFYNGYASVQRQDRLWNIIDNKGNILSPKIWFNHTYVYMKPFRAHIKDETFYFDNNNKLHKQILTFNP